MSNSKEMQAKRGRWNASVRWFYEQWRLWREAVIARGFFGGDWEHGNCHLMEEVEVLRLSAVWTPSIYDIVDNKLEHATGDRGSALKWLAFCSISSFPPRPT
jgi:hypothetical protein